MRFLHRRKAHRLYARYVNLADRGVAPWAAVDAWTRYTTYCHEHDLPITGSFRGIR